MYCCICGKLINRACTCDDCKSALKNKKMQVLSVGEEETEELSSALKSMDVLSQTVADDLKATSFNHTVDSKKFSEYTLIAEPRSFLSGTYPYKYARKKNLGVSVAAFLLVLLSIGLAFASYTISRFLPDHYILSSLAMIGSLVPFCISIALISDSFASFKTAGLQGKPRPVAALVVAILSILSLVVSLILYVLTVIRVPIILSVLGIVSFALIIIVYLISSRHF